ncbi:hypothetical protein M433DRAFT_486163 [Acidomyces richmondensis BFW]|nr:hypothetical protein M433DRAFT_486163 [Acidomyces richmondensis BFW]
MGSLSIAVALHGLITSTDTIRRKIELFRAVERPRDRTAEKASGEVSSFRIALLQLQHLLDGPATAAGSIYLDQLCVVLTGSVRRFSELEGLLGYLPTVTKAEAPHIDPSCWSRHERELAGVLARIEPYRRSLELIIQLIEPQPPSGPAAGTPARMLEEELEQAKEQMLAGDPDLAAKIVGKGDAHEDAVSSLPTAASKSPEFPSESEARRPSWRVSWRTRSSNTPRNRTPSLTTRSSITSGSVSLMSEASSSASRISLATYSKVGEYQLPISAEEVLNGHHYVGIAIDSPPGVDEENEEVDAVLPLEKLHLTPIPPRLTIPSYPTPAPSGSLSTSSQPANRPPLPSPAAARPTKPAPTALLSMTASSYKGYFRPMFDAPLPVPLAICACALLLNLKPLPPNLAISDTAVLRSHAAELCDALSTAPSPAKVRKLIEGYSVESVIFALRASLEAGPVPKLAAKVVGPVYERLAEARKDEGKMSKAWTQMTKTLKKLPQECQVPLLFVLNVSRLLAVRRVTVGGRTGATWILDHFWPEAPAGKDKGISWGEGEAGRAGSALLLQNYIDLPDEAPSTVESIKYRFPGTNAGPCDLLVVLSGHQGPSAS